MLDTRSMEDVLKQLDGVIEGALERKSRLGYFAVFQRKISGALKSALEAGEFENTPRMEALAVALAQAYFDALEARDRHQRPALVWQKSFDLLPEFWPILLQHLLMGLNAQTNLDLGLAVARICPGAELADLEGDFFKLSELLQRETLRIKSELGEAWPTLNLLDSFSRGLDGTLLNYKGAKAGRNAWGFAQELVALPADKQGARIEKQDHIAADISDRISSPGMFKQPLLDMVRIGERDGIREIIKALL